ncbi:TPA: hypothetical protein QCY11_003936 [Bacillus cytotoxicus]|uniref:hypothetical protein n=1 Tax=Bacillus cytotoxicus TaxID=580165 RepID=UPI00331090C0|nr:hypothetical protein [Bacillus cytotoxicus]
MDELKVVEEQPKYRLGDFQFFARKKDEEELDDIEDDEEEEEEEEEKPKPKRKSKSKSEEDAPQWAKTLMSTIQEVIKPKEQEAGAQKVPVPPKPKVEEDEEPEVEEVEETDNKPKKKSFLSWFL